ncbi:CU044_2847 family protein [Streptomyces sp. NPDC002431]
MSEETGVGEHEGFSVPVDVDGQTVHFSIAPGGGRARPDLGEEQEISWRRPTLAPVLDGLTHVARAMGTRLQQTGASKATVEFGCDVSVDSGQLFAVFGKATSKSAWKVTLEWTAPEAPPGAPGTPAPGTSGV